jgi:hypothetical protein
MKIYLKGDKGGKHFVGEGSSVDLQRKQRLFAISLFAG